MHAGNKKQKSEKQKVDQCELKNGNKLDGSKAL